MNYKVVGIIIIVSILLTKFFSMQTIGLMLAILYIGLIWISSGQRMRT